MLALSRKKNEAIIINNNIEITVLDIRGDQIKLGIAAPKEIPIYRKEVYIQIQNENKQATENTDVSGIEELKKLL
ncbi:MAG: carbon storage regulator CsrA [Butyrivibrio sp.]|jgi:carbon storage regulator|nr:carbon storage regulator CsrA [Butyrivibrio sp.]